jgi:single-strand DNA-binding protein
MARYEVKNVLIATTPRFLVTQAGKSLCSFRVAESISSSGANWYTVVLSDAVCDEFQVANFGKGKRIDVVGNLRVREWDNGERTGTSVEIEMISFSEASPSTHGCNCPSCTI